MFNFKSIKTQLIIFLAIFAIYLSIINQDIRFIFSTIVAVFSAIFFELALLYLKNKKLDITESSIISGLIIGYVLSSSLPFWIFVLAALFAISSKYLIKINNKHIFNPAALGIFLTIILFRATTVWQGTYFWYILAPLGICFIYKINKLEILVSYSLAAFILFFIQAIVQKTPILNIFGYFSYFFIFIMLIEPRTTPITPLGKILFGIGVAVLIFVFTEIGLRFDAEIFSLLLLNLFTPLLNKLKINKGVTI